MRQGATRRGASTSQAATQPTIGTSHHPLIDDVAPARKKRACKASTASIFHGGDGPAMALHADAVVAGLAVVNLAVDEDVHGATIALVLHAGNEGKYRMRSRAVDLSVAGDGSHRGRRNKSQVLMHNVVRAAK